MVLILLIAIYFCLLIFKLIFIWLIYIYFIITVASLIFFFCHIVCGLFFVVFFKLQPVNCIDRLPEMWYINALNK